MKIERTLAHRVIEGQAFVMDPAHQKLHNLNATGTAIWKALAAGRTPAEIAGLISEEFDVPEAEAKTDVTAFLEKLKTLHLIED